MLLIHCLLTQEKAPTAAANAPAVTTDWKEFVSPDGRKYYYNKTTKESRWTMPDEMKATQAAKASSSPAPVQVRTSGSTPLPYTMRFGSTKKVLAKRMFKYHEI